MKSLFINRNNLKITYDVKNRWADLTSLDGRFVYWECYVNDTVEAALEDFLTKAMYDCEHFPSVIYTNYWFN